MDMHMIKCTSEKENVKNVRERESDKGLVYADGVFTMYFNFPGTLWWGWWGSTSVDEWVWTNTLTLINIT